MPMVNTKGLEMPTGLSHEAQLAWAIIEKWAIQHGGVDGQKTFYSPEEWKQRGERHGQNAILIVMHDGGPLSLYNGGKTWEEDTAQALKRIGVYMEPQTGWYSGIYLIPRG